MTSSAEHSSSIFASPSAGRRILHKFASPFGQKTRSITEFIVRADDPHRQYSPGEKVTGAVVLKVVKPIRVTHISVCLHGFVQVHKTPGSPTESVRGYGVRAGRSQGKKSGEYFGNGFASLFEDESVLCGEGRLAEGSYRFDFEVTFPKDIDLPSSIEFERGTISYMVTATLTRPTTMNPTISHGQRLFLCERIDIANLLPPKSRTITLEPVSRKSKSRGPSKKLGTDSQGRAGTSSISAGTQDSSSSTPNPNLAQEMLRTPSVSEASVDSRVSSSVGGRSVSASVSQSQRTSDSLSGSNGLTTTADRTITATVESLKGGCLRGDSIPIRIRVSHTKHVRSMNGVIITLYRLARVDLHPALPIGPMSDGLKRKYEDYYPKSLTGLGGLSLSGSGSSHVFRKDLAQTVVPLIVDPQTLKTEINGRVSVPDDAFPTINTVPGSMISFRYYIEVVLDIQGKLTGSDKSFFQRNAGNYGANISTPHDTSGTLHGDGGNPSCVLPGPAILDTAPIRRDKSVVTSMFEVIVGTLDSERRKGKGRARMPEEDEVVREPQPLSPDAPHTRSNSDGTIPTENPSHSHPDWYNWDPSGETEWSNYPDATYNGVNYSVPYETGDYGDQYEWGGGGYQHYNGYAELPFVPPPAMENEEALPEKERLRRAEARLMPSQPPVSTQSRPSDGMQGPSAPILSPEQPAPSEIVAASASQSNVGFQRNGRHGDAGVLSRTELSSGLPGPVVDPGRGSADTKGEDEQEMQRRQLQLNTSAPALPTDVGNGDSAAVPSAPILSEGSSEFAGEINHQHGDRSGDHLPRYTH